ncbi:MAG: oxalurate catabolism protein HpxZ [Geminicoccaceae bacterium]|nr:MAG: oxalurate catabolism protein HpxZ [Geminicoccaceae bacterium]
MIIDDASVIAEVRSAFDSYEAALMANDVATLDRLFWRDPRTIRYGVAETLYGHDAISAFRKARTGDIQRTLERVAITAFGPDTAIAFCEYRMTSTGTLGRQSQTWVRMPEGWRIVAAHVSRLPQD